MKKRKNSSKKRQLDVLGIGSPLFDVVVNVGEEMLRELGIKKGSMNLISKEESTKIFEKLGDTKQELVPGGSVSNTISGVSLLGNEVSFLGVVGSDEFGKKYHEKIEKEGIVSSLCFRDGDMTGHVIVLVTPDGERTMTTHLGASASFNKDHIKEEDIKRL